MKENKNLSPKSEEVGILTFIGASIVIFFTFLGIALLLTSPIWIPAVIVIAAVKIF